MEAGKKALNIGGDHERPEKFESTSGTRIATTTLSCYDAHVLY